MTKKAILGLMILLMLALPFSAVSGRYNYQENQEQVEEILPWSDSFSKSDFYIYIGTRKIDLFQAIDPRLFAIRFEKVSSWDNAKKGKINKVIADYKLAEISGVAIGSGMRLFEISESLELEKYNSGYYGAAEKFLNLLNDLLKEEMVEFISPVFQYGRNLQILTGEVVIRFHPELGAKAVSNWLNTMGLNRAKDEEGSIATVKVTRKSGRNIFEVAHSLHPIFADEPVVGNLGLQWFKEARPIFTVLRSPIEITTYSYPLESPDAYSGNRARSFFKYILKIEYDLEFFSEKDIRINLAELQIDSAFFKEWLPVDLATGQEIKPAFFEIHGSEQVNPPQITEEKFSQEIEYTVSISRAGTWLFPPVRVVYTFVSPVSGKEETRDTLSGEAIVQIGSILPFDAPTVNDISGFFKTGEHESATASGALFKIFGLLSVLAALAVPSIFFVKFLSRRRMAAEVPQEINLQTKWQDLSKELVIESNRREFFKKITRQFTRFLGLKHFSDEMALSGSDISEIEKKLQKELSKADAAKVLRFLKKSQKEVYGPYTNKTLTRKEISKLEKEAKELLFGE